MAGKRATKSPARKAAPRKRAPSRKKAEKPKTYDGVCFTIMPFGGWFNSYYETVFQPAITATGLTPRRADDLFKPSPIINDIWELTQEAKIILADMTDSNPNVFYELGLAHALSKPAILVTQSMDYVPFDLQNLRTIVYNKDDPAWGQRLSSNIESAIREVLEAPAQSVLPTFLSTTDAKGVSPVSREEKEFIALRQDIDGLKRQIRRIDSSSNTPGITAKSPGTVSLSSILADLPDDIYQSEFQKLLVPDELLVRRRQKVSKPQSSEKKSDSSKSKK